MVFVALLGVILSSCLTPAQVGAWGWRIPFLIGCLIIPFIFTIRKSLQETEVFLARKERPTTAQVWHSLVRNWRLIIVGALTVTMSTVSFYFITAYTPTFGREVLKLPGSANLVVTLCVGLSNLLWIPLMGSLSDRYGRRPMLIGFALLTLLTAYPALAWLAIKPSFTRLLLVELWLSFLYGSYNGAMIVHLTELMPPAVRTAGFSLAYSLATALFGGLTPLISTWLISETHDKAAPGYWLTIAAICGLGATLNLFHRASVERRAASMAH